MVMATISLCGDVMVLLGESESVDIARKLAPPLWSNRGRLRVKLTSASSSGSRRGGEGEVGVVGSSAAWNCSESRSCALMTE